jgi:16S rRNA processing protein RimM
VADRICVAQIGGAHGLRGEVKLKSFTADPMAVSDYGPLTTEDGSASFEIEAVRPAKDHLIARFRGVGDRDTAERLANVRLFVPRERLPPLAADEFYHTDLIGLSAVTADGSEIGTVVAIHDFGAGDIVELLPAGGKTSIMLPFAAAFVLSVDIAHGRIVVAPPESAPESGGGATE